LRENRLDNMSNTYHTPSTEVKDSGLKDFIDDSGELFSRIFLSREDLPPTLRKRAHVADREGTSSFDDSAFADPFGRKFLVNTPEHALVSFSYLAAQGAEDTDPRLASARKMASLFGISSEILDVERMIASRISASRQKTAKPRDEWEVSASQEVDGERESVMVRGRGERDLKVAARVARSPQFVKDYPPEIVSSMAEGLLKTASSFGWSVGDSQEASDLMILAGRGVPDRELIEASIFSRSSFFPRSTGERLSSSARKAASVSEFPGREGLLEVAFALGRIDRASGANLHYGAGIPDPLRSVFHHSDSYARKTASRVRVGAGTEYLSYQADSPEFRKAASMVATLGGLDESSIPDDGAAIAAWVPPSLEGAFRKIAQDLGIAPKAGAPQAPSTAQAQPSLLARSKKRPAAPPVPSTDPAASDQEHRITPTTSGISVARG